MFNDVLSKEECEALVQRLATCAFPFQCAHGRPSMVPLVNLGSLSTVGGASGGEGWSEQREQKDMVMAWKRWEERSKP